MDKRLLMLLNKQEIFALVQYSHDGNLSLAQLTCLDQVLPSLPGPLLGTLPLS